MVTALTAPAPAPSAEAVARAEIETAVALERVGRYSDAIKPLSRAIESNALSDADRARALFDRALAYDGLGRMPAAVADYTASLQIEPGLAPALNNRADLYRRAGQLAEAKRDYEAALKCPNAAREHPLYGLGLVAREEGDAAAADAYFQQALAANPSFAPALAALPPRMTESGLRPSQDVGPPALPAVAVPAVSPPANGKGTLVQLGAFQSEALARGAWELITGVSGESLRALTPVVTPVDVAGKRLWRLRTAVADKPQASALCAALTQRQLACITVRR
jgi:tetratricopeptide (TPR) repeat protein